MKYIVVASINRANTKFIIFLKTNENPRISLSVESTNNKMKRTIIAGIDFRTNVKEKIIIRKKGTVTCLLIGKALISIHHLSVE